jgi:hypothetical protein
MGVDKVAYTPNSGTATRDFGVIAVDTAYTLVRATRSKEGTMANYYQSKQVASKLPLTESDGAGDAVESASASSSRLGLVQRRHHRTGRRPRLPRPRRTCRC